MITRITGRLIGIEGNAAEVETPGSGLIYEVLIPAYLAARLGPKVGESITLWTRQTLEGQAQGTHFTPRLLGFGSLRERRFFELFTTVKGLGIRKALRALADEPGAIAGVIVARDPKRLQRLPEIGAKLAQQIVMDLHVKAGEFAEGIPGAALEPAGTPAKSAKPRRPKEAASVFVPVPPTSAALPSGSAAQAVRALVTLGEPAGEAERLVQQALADQPELGTPDEILAAAIALRA